MTVSFGSLFLPIGWNDMLEVVVAQTFEEKLNSRTGLDIPGDSADNLVTRAHAMLTEKHDLPG